MPIRKFISKLVKSSDILYAKKLLLEDDIFKIIGTLVKIGKTQLYRSAQRHQELRKNNKNAELKDLIEPLSLAHPRDIGLKLTDATMREAILNYDKNIKKLSKETAEKYFGLKDGYTEWLVFPSSYSENKITSIIESVYNNVLKEDSLFIPNKEKELDLIRGKNEYVVSTKLAQKIMSSLNRYKNLKPGSKVLIIREFPNWFIDRLIQYGLKVTYLIDNPNTVIDLPTNENLTIQTNLDKYDILEYVKNMDKFDLVIANPPYEIGNAIITEVMKHCDEAVVLMPLKQYKKQDSKLWEKVQQLEVVNSSWFEDAYMSDNLNIAYLSNFQNGPYKNYDDLTFLSLNDSYKLFYKYNLNNRDKYIKGYHKKYGVKVLKELGVEPNLWFAYTERTSQNGVHTTQDCHDYRWNIEKINYVPVSDAGQAFLLFAKFNCEIEHKNFCYWWYKSKGLTHKAIKGLNRTSGTCEEVFPQIDWSRTDVEYTDEYVLEQMGLKWNENKDGVEKL